MNNFSGVGRLTADPDLKYSQGGKTIVKFTLAINRDRETADFLRCVAFGKTGELIAEHFSKGDQIGIIGSVWTGSFDKEDGTKVYTTDIAINKITFIGSKNKSKNEKSNEIATKGDVSQDDFPF
jgi:single-strand DNA-binding protein